MAIISLAGYDRSAGIDSLSVIQSPIILSGDDFSVSSDSLSRIGQGVIFGGVDSATSGDTLTNLTFILGIDGSDESYGEDFWLSPPPLGNFFDYSGGADIGQIGFIKLLGGTDASSGADSLTSWGNTIFLDGTDASVATDELTVLKGITFYGSDSSEGEDWGELGFVMPFLRDPYENEVRGTINLIRNPSLEYDEIGMADWISEAGIVLYQSSAAAWDGLQSAYAEVDAGAGTLEIVVSSQRGLYLSGILYWIGSFALEGDAPSVDYFLRITYTDASTEDGDVKTVVPATDWVPLATETVPSDPAKFIDWIDLVLQVAQDSADTILHIDGAQIEEDKAGGNTPVATGDMGAGYAWYGTPGFSVSIRYPALAS